VPARILVIEDNAANLELMVYLLAAFGHTTLSAGDGEEGLAKAIEERPDLIICDVHLPKMDGYEVVRRLKTDTACQSIPTVAVTALAMVGDRDRVLSAGFDGYLTKPIDPEIFVAQIEALLGPDRSSLPSRPDDNAAAPPRPTASAGKILVVDDLPSNRDFARAVLEAFGHEVWTACGPSEGLEIAIQQKPDLILSDVCMRDASGYDFIQAVKADARLAKIPFAFITSTRLEEEDRAKALSLGAQRYMVRPIEPQEFLREIESCLREAC
jgi:two-component system cell cycle response regulator